MLEFLPPDKFIERLRAMWLNVIRVQRLAQHLVGSDLAKAVYGIDEKPLRLNEGGSKCLRTLEIAGRPPYASR